MVRSIRLYVEGGGGKESRDDLRQAFSGFLSGPRSAARERGVQWRVVMCGSREDTFKAFRNGVDEHPDSRVFLLVDADRPVQGTPREHLSAGETRWNLAFADDEQCHLMAEVMESWFLADHGALQEFYSQEFATGQLPKRVNVEDVPKADVFVALDLATRKTKKGRYHKIQHGPFILERLDPEKVRTRAPHCDALFKALQEAIG